MNQARMNALVQVYLENFPRVTFDGKHREEFKWTAVRTFQENWNLDAEDFADMVKRSFRDLSVLVTGLHNQPIAGLTALAKASDESKQFLRLQFQKLFSDDGGDLNARMERVTFFRDAVNAELHNRFPGKDNWEQSNRSVLACLALWRPEENFFFMSSKASDWQKYIGFRGRLGYGDAFSLPEYYRMCEEILQDLHHYHPQVLQCGRRCREAELPACDDRDHITVYDLLSCSSAYELYTRADLPPTRPGPGHCSKRSLSWRRKSTILTGNWRKSARKPLCRSFWAPPSITPGGETALW